MTTTTETAAAMLANGICDLGHWTPNEWGGWDYRDGSRPLRITWQEGSIRLLMFTDWHSRVLVWEARFEDHMPKGIVAAAIAEALA